MRTSRPAAPSTVCTGQARSEAADGSSTFFADSYSTDLSGLAEAAGWTDITVVCSGAVSTTTGTAGATLGSWLAGAGGIGAVRGGSSTAADPAAGEAWSRARSALSRPIQ